MRLSILVWIAIALGALLFGAVDQPDPFILFELRLPRVLIASAVGMGLAVVGAVLQTLFSNPLCEPYTLGISSGAALSAVVCGTLGLDFGIGGVTVSAFVGAIVFTLLLLKFSKIWAASSQSLLLAGVMLGFLGSGLMALWMTVVDPNGMQSAMSWLFGDLSRASLDGSLIVFGLIVLLTAAVWMRWRDLDSLLLGEEDAQSMGASVERLRWQVVLLAALLIGICVSAAGMIGFVGLLVPHVARSWVGSRHRLMLPVCAVLGATALTLADLISRVAAAPTEIPVGVITSLIGAPLFVWVLAQRRGWAN